MIEQGGDTVERPGHVSNRPESPFIGMTDEQEKEAGTPRGPEADDAVERQKNRNISPDDKDEL